MKIYRKKELICDLPIDENSMIVRRLMVENSLNLRVSVSSDDALGLKIGDYTDIDTERYVITDEPTYSMRGGVYDYAVLMRGALHTLEGYTMPDGGRDEQWYFGSPTDHINHVYRALLIKEPDWKIELPDLTKVPDNSAKNINYANMSILSALHAICSTENGWGLEFDVLPGKIIRFDREIKNTTTRTFEYGQGKGLYEMSRGALSGEKISTRFIAYGGTTNMINGVRLSFAPINDNLPYVEKNVDLYGLREERVNFDYIYPNRKSSITDDAKQVEAGKANWTVVDSALDFDLNDQVVEDAVIMFNTGDCVGIEFRVVAYDHATKTITFAEHVDQSGGENGEAYVLPNINRKPRKGDQYILVNIAMPESYITSAQGELLEAAKQYADKKAVPQRSYSVTCDPRAFKKWKYRPLPGDGVRLIDAPNGVDYQTRVIGIEYPVLEPDKVKLTLADKVPIPASVVMAKSLKEVKTKMAILDRGQITEERMRAIFHPLKGRKDLDIAAKTVDAERVVARNVEAVEVGIGDTLHSTDFLSGLLGYGFSVNAKGEMEADSLKLRKFLETPELVKNRIRVIGTQAWLTEAEVVDRMVQNPFVTARLTNEENELLGYRRTDCLVTFRRDPAFRVDDILRGIYEYNNGFQTVFLRVIEVLPEGYILRSINGLSAQEGMVLARQGNYTDASRQGAVYIDSAEGYIRVLGGMNSTDIRPENLMAQLGNLKNLIVFGITNMPEVGLYTRAGIFKGLSATDVGADASGTSDALKKLLGELAYKNGLTASDVGADAAGTSAALQSQLKGLAYQELVQLAQLGDTVIQGGYIKAGLINVVALAADTAFINRLTVGSLHTTDNLVSFNDGVARIGMAKLDNAGNMIVEDSGGVTRVRITNGAISSYVEGSSGSTPSFSSGATTNGLYNVGGSITITTVGGDVIIDGELEAVARVADADREGSMVEATLWLYRGETRVARVAGISAQAGGRSLDSEPLLYDRQTTAVNFRGFCITGTYNLKIEYLRGGFGYGSDGSSSASVSQFSWDYSPTTGATTLGSNGFGAIWNKDNLDITEVVDGKLHKTLKADVVDMPGVLGKAQISSRVIYKQWGVPITTVAVVNVGGANLRVHHSVGHANYSAICTPFGRGSIVEVVDENAQYVDLYASGSFNIMLTGDNRK